MVLESADAVQGPTQTHPVVVLEHVMRTTYIDVKAQAIQKCMQNGEYIFADVWEACNV